MLYAYVLCPCLQPKNRRDILLEYVKNVQPEFMELFIKRAPSQVFMYPFSLHFSLQISIRLSYLRYS
jgi:hypothetical protein